MGSRVLEVSARVKARLEQIAKQMESGGTLRVGFLEGSTEISGDKVVSVPMIAAIQNFGAPKVGIPPRPFFTNFVKDYQDTWGKAISTQLALNGYDTEKALRIVGEGMKGQLQQSITDLMTPPLSKVTLMLRKMKSEGGPNFVVTGATVGEAARRIAAGESYGGVSTKPLIDSGQMQQAVDYEVVS